MGCLDRSQLRLVETGSEGVEGDQRPALCELAFLEEVSDLQNNRWPDDTASQTTSMWLQQLSGPASAGLRSPAPSRLACASGTRARPCLSDGGAATSSR